MRVRLNACLYLLAAAVLSRAADLPGFALYKAENLKAYQTKLGSKMTSGKVATQNLDRYQNHLTMVAHREGNGQAEVHSHVADIFVVQSGEATLVVGGHAEGAKTTQPGELRAPSIKGGEQHKLSAGDIVHIPAKMPHQLLVEQGKQVTYFVVKVQAQ